MKARRTDANQTAIVEALIAAGCMVQSLAMVACGCPDLLWIKAGRIGLMEIKDGDKPPSDRRLTLAEDRWTRMSAQHGYIVPVVETVEQALAVVDAELRWIKEMK